MGKTILEKILERHSSDTVKPGAIVDVEIDVRAARDFGGANVVKNLRTSGLEIADSTKTLFTFDCNPGGSDQSYASNQHLCRLFARETGVPVYDINSGIGTHLAMDNGHVVPGSTFVSTDSHANIIGALGAFGQGMGDQDIAAAFATGKIWFKVPPTVKVVLKGTPGSFATPKDVGLACLKFFGANGLLGYAAEFYGDYVDGLDVDGRITIASLATEMGAIIALFPPNHEVIDFCRSVAKTPFEPIYADADALYEKIFEIGIEGLEPLISRPGHPEDVVAVREIAGRKIDSAFFGSCTNGRLSDFREAAEILKGRKVAPGVVYKVVPATDAVWKQLLKEGLLEVFKEAGALIGNAGCAGCAAGQIGQNGPGEVTISTGNRNFAGKQGKGEVYLASPATVAASAVAGMITSAANIPTEPARFEKPAVAPSSARKKTAASSHAAKSTEVEGRVWVIPVDNIDTDMIYHNRHLTITDRSEMGQYTFGNLKGYEDFSKKAKSGDIIVTGKNFGAGSSRQQAVDCFLSLGISMIIAKSFGAIYERNAINAGLPILTADLDAETLKSGDVIRVDFKSGKITIPSTGRTIQGSPFSDIQMQIYQRGGLLVK
ncbi:3-isopropylmalate dehydratase large subunit [bacterium]|nr:3-isopropylmalate dehydratase large subunit [bacterium]